MFCTQHLRGVEPSENTSQIATVGTILKTLFVNHDVIDWRVTGAQDTRGLLLGVVLLGENDVP